MSVRDGHLFGSATQRRRGPDRRAGALVGEVMVRWPLVHPPSTTVAQARNALADPHHHLLLVVAGPLLLGTVDRSDLDDAGRGGASALSVARLAGRTVLAGARVDVVHAEMLAVGQRRRAVVDAGGALLGLLCLKASGAGFCSDAGIAARHATAG